MKREKERKDDKGKRNKEKKRIKCNVKNWKREERGINNETRKRKDKEGGKDGGGGEGGKVGGKEGG